MSELDVIQQRYFGNKRMVPMKLLSLYYPARFLPIFQVKHLEYFLTLFGETFSKGIVETNLRLLTVMRNLSEFSGFDTLQMANFLYDCFSPLKAKKEKRTYEKVQQTKKPDKKQRELTIERIAEIEPASVTGLEAYPELESEEDGDESVADAKPVFSQAVDWSIGTLREKWERKLIDLQPKYQREYVWRLKPELPSRLIESLLLDIPIPPIYLGKLSGGMLEVVDGQQRLTTLINFISNDFALQKLMGLKSLNGYYFRDLSQEHQSKILDTPIRSIVIDAGRNLSLRYEIFERLNRGSMALNEQELRTCVFRGPFSNLLTELEGAPIWRKIKGTLQPEPRFAEREMILRFFALAQRIDAYTGNLKKFLNEYMGDYAPIDPNKIQELGQTFLQTMENPLC